MGKILDWAVKNWKTSATGICVAICQYIVFEPMVADRPLHYRVASFLVSSGFAYLGIAQKDPGEKQ